MINFRSELHRELLGYYFANPKAEHYVRELAKLLSVDGANLSRELNLLAGAKIFTFSRRGREKYFSINPGHPLYEELKKVTAYIVSEKQAKIRKS